MGRAASAIALLLGLLLGLLAAGPAWGEDPAQAPATGPAPIPDPPQWAFFAAPLVTYDSVYQLGGGAFGQVVRADPTGVEPFKASLSGQAYLTTGGYQSHYLLFDLPAVGGSRFRWGGRVRRIVFTGASYFGLGNDLPREDVGEDSKRYQYQARRMLMRTDLRRRVGRSQWELYGTYTWSLEGVSAYTPSLLQEQQPQGWQGGKMAWGQLGGFYDSRTDEIDPWDGITLDFAVRAAAPWLGSDWLATGTYAAFSGWWSLNPRLVLAGRFLVDSVWGNPPFFTRATLGGLAGTVVGGRYLLRGLPEERLRADAVAGSQLELRFRFANLTLFRKVGLGLALVPFVDAAQVATWENEVSPFDPHVTGGGGLRININDLLILRADVGVGVERYVDAPTRRPMLQVYVLSGHPF